MTNSFLEIQSLVLRFKHLGFKETTYANLYAKALHIAPQAWLHMIFKPLTDNDIIVLKEKLKNLPKFYEDFLKLSNGFSIYDSTLSFYGLRKDSNRNLDSVWQPYDLFDLNSWDKPADSTENEFFFGGYNWDGSYVYYDYSDFKIKRCSCDSIKPLNIWDSFEDYVDNETIRIVKLFDDKGMQIDEDLETQPNSLS